MIKSKSSPCPSKCQSDWDKQMVPWRTPQCMINFSLHFSLRFFATDLFIFFAKRGLFGVPGDPQPLICLAMESRTWSLSDGLLLCLFLGTLPLSAPWEGEHGFWESVGRPVAWEGGGAIKESFENRLRGFGML